MSSTTGSTMRSDGTAVAIAGRAAAGAALAVAVTFAPSSARHSETFGLAVLGAFLLLQALVLGLGVRGLAVTRPGRTTVLVRAAVSAAAGVVALVTLGGGPGGLRPVESVAFLVLGALEVAGGLRRVERSDLAGDAVVIGGLQIVVGAMLVILNEDVLLAVGVLAAWGAIAAVYLGIAAVSAARRDRAA